MIEYLPIAVTPAMVVSANVIDDKDQLAAYSASTTYAIGDYANNTLGFVYRSKTSGNINNPLPTGEASDTFWEYSSSYTPRKWVEPAFSRGERRYDPTTQLVYEVVAHVVEADKPFVTGDIWIKEAKVKELGYPEWIDNYYVLDQACVKQYGVDELIGVTNADERATYLYKRITAGNGSYPPSYPANWAYQYRVNSCVGLHDPSRSYPAGYRVSDIEKNVYLAAVASKNDPLDNLRPWVAIGPNNRSAMFDGKITVGTKANKLITATVAIPAASPCNTVSFFGCVSDSITVTVRSGLGGSVVYTQTKVMSEYGDAVYPDLVRRKAIFLNLPTPSNAHITYSVEGVGAVELGFVAFGTAKSLGLVEYGASVSIIDLSIGTDNGFGELEFEEGAFKESLELSCMLDKAAFNRVHNRFVQMRGKVHVIYASDDDGWSESLLQYGSYSDYANVIQHPTASLYNFNFTSLIS